MIFHLAFRSPNKPSSQGSDPSPVVRPHLGHLGHYLWTWGFLDLQEIESVHESWICSICGSSSNGSQQNVHHVALMRKFCWDSPCYVDLDNITRFRRFGLTVNGLGSREEAGVPSDRHEGKAGLRQLETAQRHFCLAMGCCSSSDPPYNPHFRAQQGDPVRPKDAGFLPFVRWDTAARPLSIPLRLTLSSCVQPRLPLRLRSKVATTSI